MLSVKVVVVIVLRGGVVNSLMRLRYSSMAYCFRLAHALVMVVVLLSAQVVVVIVLSSGVVYPLDETPVLVEGLLLPVVACVS